jgi:hypothetical protein
MPDVRVSHCNGIYELKERTAGTLQALREVSVGDNTTGHKGIALDSCGIT